MGSKIILAEADEIRSLLHEELKTFFEKFATPLQKSTQWMDSKDVPAYLGISRKTWQTYRDKRLIPFAQIGRKIRVRQSDLDAFLQSFTVNSIHY